MIIEKTPRQIKERDWEREPRKPLEERPEELGQLPEPRPSVPSLLDRMGILPRVLFNIRLAGITEFDSQFVGKPFRWKAYTPVMQGGTVAGEGTYVKQLGRECQVGKIRYFGFWVSVSAHTGTGQMRITIPSIAANQEIMYSFSIAQLNKITFPADVLQITGKIVANTDYVGFMGIKSALAAVDIPIPVAFNAEVFGEGFYEVP